MHKHIYFPQITRQAADFLVYKATQLPLAPVLQSVQSGFLISSRSLVWVYTMHTKGQDSFKPKHLLSILSLHAKQLNFLVFYHLNSLPQHCISMPVASQAVRTVASSKPTALLTLGSTNPDRTTDLHKQPGHSGKVLCRPPAP